MNKKTISATILNPTTNHTERGPYVPRIPTLPKADYRMKTVSLSISPFNGNIAVGINDQIPPTTKMNLILSLTANNPSHLLEISTNLSNIPKVISSSVSYVDLSDPKSTQFPDGNILVAKDINLDHDDFIAKSSIVITNGLADTSHLVSSNGRKDFFYIGSDEIYELLVDKKPSDLEIRIV